MTKALSRLFLEELFLLQVFFCLFAQTYFISSQLPKVFPLTEGRKVHTLFNMTNLTSPERPTDLSYLVDEPVGAFQYAYLAPEM